MEMYLNGVNAQWVHSGVSQDLWAFEGFEFGFFCGVGTPWGSSKRKLADALPSVPVEVRRAWQYIHQCTGHDIMPLQ